MPIFEYQCEHCGQIIEKIQRRPLNEVPCPACGKGATKRVSLTSAGGVAAGGGCSAPAGSGFT